MKDHNLHNKAKIRAELEKGFILTVKSAWKSCRTTELRAYVSQLKKDGLKIKDQWRIVNGKRFKEYYL